MIRPQVGYDDVAKIAREGSPLVMRAVGRMYGLADGDVVALRSGVPWWLLATAAVGVGFVLGVRVHASRYGSRLPQLLTG